MSLILVTGSAGHLGEALMLTLREQGRAVRGVDIVASPFTDAVGTIADRDFVRAQMKGVGAVLHAATLHKPHVATHDKLAFVDTNVTGTLNLLEQAVAAGVGAFVFTSTTSTFGRAMAPAPGAPAVWVTEDLRPVPKNIYGVTKVAAEDLCQIVHHDHGLPCIVLRTSRFFPEDDDEPAARAERSTPNLQANEFLHRRVDIEDVVDAHLCALREARRLGFGRYIVSATTPFRHEDLAELPRDAGAVLDRRVPGWRALYDRHGWTISGIARVYVNDAARSALGWQARIDFAAVLERLRSSGDIRSALARRVGIKGYHPRP